MFTWSIPADWHGWSQTDNPSVPTCSPEASQLIDTGDPSLITLCSHMFTWSIPAEWHEWSQSDNPSVPTCSPEASLLIDTGDPSLITPLFTHVHLKHPCWLTQMIPFWQPHYIGTWVCGNIGVCQNGITLSCSFLADWHRWPHSDSPSVSKYSPEDSCPEDSWRYLAGSHRWPHSDNLCSQILTYSLQVETGGPILTTPVPKYSPEATLQVHTGGPILTTPVRSSILWALVDISRACDSLKQ